MINKHTITIKGKQYPCDMPVIELQSKPIPLTVEPKSQCLEIKKLKKQNARLKELLERVYYSKCGDKLPLKEIENEVLK